MSAPTLFPQLLRKRTALIAAAAVGITLISPATFASADDSTPTAAPATKQVAFPAVPKSIRKDAADTEPLPDAQVAVQRAQETGDRVEIESQRTAYNTSYANPDGTGTVEISGAPVRAKNEIGEWAEVDYSLSEDEDGYLRPAISPVDVRFSAGGSTEAGRLTLEDGSAITTSWRDPLPAPVIEDATARYELDAVTDLLVTATPSGFTTRFELSAAPVGPLDTFVLGMTTKKLALTQDGGQLVATNPDGDEVAGTTTLTAWDSEFDAAGDPVPVELDAELTVVSDNAARTVHSLALTTPDGWLEDPQTVYPVTIDPDVSTRTPNKDTFVRGDYSDPKGGSHALVVGSETSNDYALSYIRFSVSELEDKEIISADLRLRQYYATTCSPRGINVRNLSEPFTNDTTWADRPAAATGNYGSASFNHGNGSFCADAYESISITPLVDEWIGQESKTLAGLTKADQYGLRLQPIDGSLYDTSYEKRFCSMNPDSATDCNNSVYSPKLIVNYKLTADVGSLPWMTFQDLKLSTDTTAQVNLKTGNLLISVNDYEGNAPGIAPSVDRYYNSLSTRTSRTFGNWTLGTGSDVGIQVVTNPVGNTKYLKLLGPNGFIGKFNYDSGKNVYITPAGLNVTIEPITDSSSGAGPFQMVYNTSREKLKFTKTDSSLGTGGGWLSSDRDSNEDSGHNGIGLDFDYGTNFGTTTITDAAGRRIEIDNGGTAASRTAEIEVAEDGRLWQYGIVNSRLTTVTAPGGYSPTTYEYDSSGRMTALNTTYRPASTDVHKRTEFTYDTSGRIASVIRGSIQGSSFIPAATTGFSYGTQTTVVTDPLGHTSTYTLDNIGRATATEDGEGRKRTKAWTANSDAASLTTGFASDGSGGNSATIAYDEKNRAIGTTLPTGAATKAIYTVGSSCPNATTGNPYLAQCTTDANGHSSEYSYDAGGNLTEKRDKSNGAASIKNTYSPSRSGTCQGYKGQICKTEDGNGNFTSFAYDVDGNQILVDPSGPVGSTTSVFDSTGRLTSVTDGNGDTTEYAYDDLDQLLTSTFENGATTTNVWNGDGTLASMTSSSPAWIETYSYNALGQETNRTAGTALSSTLTQQGYDAAGNLTSFTDTAGTIGYTYNNANDLTQVIEPSGTCTSSVPAANSGCIKIGYDSDAKETKRTFPGGAKQTTTRDKSGRATRIVAVDAGGATRVDIEYSYKNDDDKDTSNIQTRTAHVEQGLGQDDITHYSYDTRNRLTRAVELDFVTQRARWEYTYDASGNRTKQVLAGDTGQTAGTTNYTINGANQITSTDKDTGTWSYDSAGNQTSNGLRSQSATFGDRGNATTVAGNSFTSIGQGNANTVSSSDGRQFSNTLLGLSKQTSSASALKFTRDGDGELVSYRNASNAAFYYLTDSLGSVVGLFDSTGAWRGGYSYAPYGEIRHSSTDAAVVANTQRYIGGYYEGSGIYKLGARYYDAELGRFTQMDPSGQEAAPYAYASCDPVNGADPTGLITTCEWSLGVAGVAGIGATAFGLAGVVAAPTVVGGFAAETIAFGLGVFALLFTIQAAFACPLGL